jgi:hypothetical protein
MVATIRTDMEYYQQTSVTLKYASRAKKVRHYDKVSFPLSCSCINLIASLESCCETACMHYLIGCTSLQVRNRSLVNRNVIGDTGIHAVTNEIERLKNRLDERSNEFENLRHTQLKDADENNALRVWTPFLPPLLYPVLWFHALRLPSFLLCSTLSCGVLLLSVLLCIVYM